MMPSARASSQVSSAAESGENEAQPGDKHSSNRYVVIRQMMIQYGLRHTDGVGRCWESVDASMGQSSDVLLKVEMDCPGEGGFN